MSSSKIIIDSRKVMGLTQESLAEKIHVSRQTISMWEIQRQFPTDSVAILAARSLNLNEDELLDQLHWDRLHQRVEQLENQYNATITVTRRQAEQRLEPNLLRKIASHTIDGITFSIKHIYKWITFDPDPKITVGCRADGMVEVHQPGEFVVVSLMLENKNEAVEVGITTGHGHILFEDDLGNRFHGMYVSGNEDSHGRRLYGTYFPYVPEATSVTIRYDIVNIAEDACDAIMFENVPLNGKGISKSLNDDTVTYNGISQHDGRDCHYVSLALNHRQEVRHVGPTKFTDNLGNQYRGGGYTKHHNNEESFNLHGLDPNATSISFKYLLARTAYAFELRDLPLPS